VMARITWPSFGDVMTLVSTMADPVLYLSEVSSPSGKKLPVNEAPTASVEFLLSCRNTDGGWGAASGVKSTIEETALAVTALSGFPGNESARQAALGGAEFLARNISDQMNPSPIGLYFSQLWYGEKLYPLIWSVEALGRVAGCG